MVKQLASKYIKMGTSWLEGESGTFKGKTNLDQRRER